MAIRKSAHEPEPESPIAFIPCSNGERLPPRPTEQDARAEKMFAELSAANARKLGVSRRAFVESACGSALALFVINQVYGCGESSSSTPFEVDAGSTLDAAKAC